MTVHGFWNRGLAGWKSNAASSSSSSSNNKVSLTDVDVVSSNTASTSSTTGTTTTVGLDFSISLYKGLKQDLVVLLMATATQSSQLSLSLPSQSQSQRLSSCVTRPLQWELQLYQVYGIQPIPVLDGYTHHPLKQTGAHVKRHEQRRIAQQALHTLYRQHHQQPLQPQQQQDKDKDTNPFDLLQDRLQVMRHWKTLSIPTNEWKAAVWDMLEQEFGESNHETKKKTKTKMKKKNDIMVPTHNHNHNHTNKYANHHNSISQPQPQPPRLLLPPIPSFFQAPFEAEWQLVYLEQQGYFNGGIVSRDGDCIILGAQRVWTELQFYQNPNNNKNKNNNNNNNNNPNQNQNDNLSDWINNNTEQASASQPYPAPYGLLYQRNQHLQMTATTSNNTKKKKDKNSSSSSSPQQQNHHKFLLTADNVQHWPELAALAGCDYITSPPGIALGRAVTQIYNPVIKQREQQQSTQQPSLARALVDRLRDYVTTKQQEQKKKKKPKPTTAAAANNNIMDTDIDIDIDIDADNNNTTTTLGWNWDDYWIRFQQTTALLRHGPVWDFATQQLVPLHPLPTLSDEEEEDPTTDNSNNNDHDRPMPWGRRIGFGVDHPMTLLWLEQQEQQNKSSFTKTTTTTTTTTRTTKTSRTFLPTTSSGNSRTLPTPDTKKKSKNKIWKKRIIRKTATTSQRRTLLQHQPPHPQPRAKTSSPSSSSSKESFLRSTQNQKNHDGDRRNNNHIHPRNHNPFIHPKEENERKHSSSTTASSAAIPYSPTRPRFQQERRQSQHEILQNDNHKDDFILFADLDPNCCFYNSNGGGGSDRNGTLLAGRHNHNHDNNNHDRIPLSCYPTLVLEGFLTSRFGLHAAPFLGPAVTRRQLEHVVKRLLLQCQQQQRQQVEQEREPSSSSASSSFLFPQTTRCELDQIWQDIHSGALLLAKNNLNHSTRQEDGTNPKNHPNRTTTSTWFSNRNTVPLSQQLLGLFRFRKPPATNNDEKNGRVSSYSSYYYPDRHDNDTAIAATTPTTEFSGEENWANQSHQDNWLWNRNESSIGSEDRWLPSNNNNFYNSYSKQAWVIWQWLQQEQEQQSEGERESTTTTTTIDWNQTTNVSKETTTSSLLLSSSNSVSFNNLAWWFVDYWGAPRTTTNTTKKKNTTITTTTNRNNNNRRNSGTRPTPWLEEGTSGMDNHNQTYHNRNRNRNATIHDNDDVDDNDNEDDNTNQIELDDSIAAALVDPHRTFWVQIQTYGGGFVTTTTRGRNTTHNKNLTEDDQASVSSWRNGTTAATNTTTAMTKNETGMQEHRHFIPILEIPTLVPPPPLRWPPKNGSNNSNNNNPFKHDDSNNNMTILDDPTWLQYYCHHQHTPRMTTMNMNMTTDNSPPRHWEEQQEQANIILHLHLLSKLLWIMLRWLS